MTLSDILDELWGKHEMLRTVNLRRLSEESSFISFIRKDLMPDEKISLIMCFFIEAYYVGILSKKYNDLIDLEIDLAVNNSFNKETVYKLFNSLKEGLTEEQILRAQSIVYSYDLGEYFTRENDKILKKWIVDKLPYDDSLFGKWSRRSVLKVFENTSKHLGIIVNNGTLLIRGDNPYLTKKILTDSFLGWKGVYLFYPSSIRYWQVISTITAFFNDGNRLQCLNYSDDMTDIFPIDNKQVEGIICLDTQTAKNTISLDRVYSFLTNDGFGLVFNQSLDTMINKKSFLSYNIPIIFENKDSNEKVYLCIQNDVTSDTVRICNTETQTFQDLEFVIKNRTKAILEEKSSKEYQKLSKSDFLYAKNSDINFDNIRRPLDQIDFVYTEISNLITERTNNSMLSSDIDDGKIIERYNLSSNPFNSTIPNLFYIDKNLIKDEDLLFHQDVNYEIRKNGFVDPYWPEKYYKYYISLLSMDKLSEEQVYFINKLTCRICTEPTILMNGNQIVKVNASPNHPICYRAYKFWDDPEGFIGYVQMKEIEVNPEFDEDFVLYQISQSYSGRGHILTLPNKEAQHKYYQKKLDEYKLANADLIKMIRQETLNDVSSQIHNTKHVISNRLSGVNSNLSNIVLEIDETDLDGKEAIIQDLNYAKAVASKVTDDLILLANIIDEKPTPENIFKFLNDYIHNIIKSKKFRIINDIDINLDGMLCMLYKASIKMAFDNIILNAERHAFNDNSFDNTLLISAKIINNSVEIIFANNGTPPDSTLTEEGFLKDGITAGPWANSGHGGAIVKKYVERNGGVTHLLLRDEKYPFIVQIQIPFYYEHN